MSYEMKYTITNNPAIDEKIDEITEQVVDAIVSRFHPKSIILKGSFGREEATVTKDNEGTLNFLSDYEVEVISLSYLLSRILPIKKEEISLNVANESNLEINLGGIKLSAYSLFPPFYKSLKPTIANYDLKYGSKMIYGRNYLERIPDFKPEDIPLWEGIRLMFNRMAEALQHFSIDYLGKYPSEEEERKLFFWINKIILAYQDALLISAKKYHYSYKIRNEMFQEIFSKHFGALDKQIPNFLPLTVKATEYKLNPNKPYSKNVVNFWFEVAEIADNVFRYIMEKERGISFDSYVEFQEKYLKHPKITLPIYQNLTGTIKMWISSHRLSSLKIITEIRMPWTRIVYSSILLVYFSLTRNSYVNESYLKKAREILSIFKELKEPSYNIPGEFNYLRKEALNLWYAICH